MNWRVTFRRKDDIGIADYVRDVEARDSAAAHSVVLEELKAAHPSDYQRYSFMSAIRVNRDDEWSVPA